MSNLDSSRDKVVTTPKRTIRVNIFGEEYPLRGDADPEYMYRVADYVDRAMRRISDKSPHMPISKVAILAALNLADEVFSQRRDSERKLEEVEDKAHDILQWLDERLTEGDSKVSR